MTQQTTPPNAATIFVRNLSYDTDEDQLKQLFANFGPIVYCLICRDKQTGDSKGSAFIKFEQPETAQQCLVEFKDFEQQFKFHLDGRNLMVLPALSREEVATIQPKDIKKAEFKKEREEKRQRKKEIRRQARAAKRQKLGIRPQTTTKPTKVAQKKEHRKNKLTKRK